MHVLFVVAGFILAAGLSSSGARSAAEPAKPLPTPTPEEIRLTTAKVREKYLNYSVKELKITEPVEVTYVAYHKDGGSIRWVLRDKAAVEHSFRTDKSPSAPLHHSSTPKGGERVLRDGGEEQRELYGVWLRWLKKNAANADDFFAGKDLPRLPKDDSMLPLSFRGLERRIFELAEKSHYGD